jgi:hypothetical protein
MYKLHVCSRRKFWGALGLAWSLASLVFGADTNVTVKHVLTGLNSPEGVAIRPDGGGETYEVFVSESGAGRVIKIRTDQPEKRIDVVAGFSIKPSSAEGHLTVGAHSLHFLDHMRLVVAGGSDDGAAFVRLYELPDPESPLTADQHKQEANVPETGKEPPFKTHIFRSIARTQANDRVGDFLLVAAYAAGESTGLVSIPVRSGTLGDAAPAPFKNADKEFAIGGIAVGKSGYVVVAANAPGDPAQPSKLIFFGPLDRRVVMRLPTDRLHIVALAYSPKSGDLFVASSPEDGNNPGGIYRIDGVNGAGAPSCTAVKIADVGNPTALAFAPDGAVYVTDAGDLKRKDAGALLKLTDDL